MVGVASGGPVRDARPYRSGIPNCEAIVLTQAINVEIATRIGPRSMLSSRRQAWLRAHRLLLLALAGGRAGLLDGVGAGTLPVTDAFSCASSSRFWSPVSPC